MTSTRFFGTIDRRMRFPALDGVRAVAVTMVFALHYGGGLHGGPILQAINWVRVRGWTGVDLFFVLSGFLITGILYDTRNDSRFFSRFFARRALRIFPVCYLLASLLLLLTPLLHYQWRWLQVTFLLYIAKVFAASDFSLYTVPSQSYAFMTADLSHLWSLCVEEQFYLLWPVAVFLVRDRLRLIWIALGLCVCAMTMRAALIFLTSAETAIIG